MIYILSGDIETGKSKALFDWIQNRTNVFGILSPNDEFNRRYFLDVATKEKFPMQADADDDDIISVGRYHFFRSAFEKANEILLNTLEVAKSGHIIVDELGKLELRSEGLHDSAKKVLEEVKNNKELHAILVIRTSLLNEIVSKYSLEVDTYFTTSDLNSGRIDL